MTLPTDPSKPFCTEPDSHEVWFPWDSSQQGDRPEHSPFHVENTDEGVASAPDSDRTSEVFAVQAKMAELILPRNKSGGDADKCVPPPEDGSADGLWEEMKLVNELKLLRRWQMAKNGINAETMFAQAQLKALEEQNVGSVDDVYEDVMPQEIDLPMDEGAPTDTSASPNPRFDLRSRAESRRDTVAPGTAFAPKGPSRLSATYPGLNVSPPPEESLSASPLARATTLTDVESVDAVTSHMEVGAPPSLRLTPPPTRDSLDVSLSDGETPYHGDKKLTLGDKVR
jgi:hypothetical protein